MTLLGKGYQVADTMDMRFVIPSADGSKRTLFTAETDKVEFEKKFDKLEVFSGIGSNRTFQLFYKPQQSVKATIKSFDLDFLSAKNGVALDKASKETIFLGKSTAVSTLTATITGAKRVLSVQKTDGTFLKITTANASALDEVKVVQSTNAVLTFYTGFADSTVLVSYVADVVGKDCMTIVLDGKSVPSAGELILNAPVYDSESELVVADFYIDLYKALLSGDFTLTFEMGKAVDVDASFDILLPKNLPDGTVNTNKIMGKMILTER